MRLLKINDIVRLIKEVPGLHVEAGELGRIIFVQRASDTRWFAPVVKADAYQVFWAGGARCWMGPNEVEAA